MPLRNHPIFRRVVPSARQARKVLKAAEAVSFFWLVMEMSGSRAWDYSGVKKVDD